MELQLFKNRARNTNKLTFSAFNTCMAITLISIIQHKHQHHSILYAYFSFKMTKRYSSGIFVVVIVFVVVSQPKSDVKHRSTRKYQIRWNYYNWEHANYSVDKHVVAAIGAAAAAATAAPDHVLFRVTNSTYIMLHNASSITKRWNHRKNHFRLNRIN